MTSASPLAGIDHVVVLMLENRSFDNILGHLYGLSGSSSNTLRDSDGHETRVPAWTSQSTDFPSMITPDPDPGEAFVDMNQQIFGLVDRPSTNTSPTEPGELGPMGGFVQNYEVLLQGGESGDTSDASDTPLKSIMNFFSAEQVPVSSQLAQTFRVVDTYHASAPCQTMPNRTFAWMGTAQGYVNNGTGITGGGIPHAPYVGPTIFSQFEDAGLGWRVYFGDVPLTATLLESWKHLDSEHFRGLSRFYEDVEAGCLPELTWLEPAYQADPNDNHPPFDVGWGEKLLAEVYNALRASCLWPKTLFILTYDEHGGCHDSVLPTCAPEPGEPYPDGFTFNRYGVRVPCILCSDLTLDPGNTPSSTSTVYDHTSILATLRARWPELGTALSHREDEAATFEDLLGSPGSAPESIPVPAVSSGLTALTQLAQADAKRLADAAAAGTSPEELVNMLHNSAKDLVMHGIHGDLQPYLHALAAAVTGFVDGHPVLKAALTLVVHALSDVAALVAEILDDAEAAGLAPLLCWLTGFLEEHHA